MFFGISQCGKQRSKSKPSGKQSNPMRNNWGILVHEQGFSFYPSDQANFPWGVGICALNKRGKTLYLSRIHTKKDTILERTNVNLLRAALITYICRDAAQ